ncbi:MAG: DNA lyase [Candidatus Kapaibacteriota bacterium]|jgi:N-glycosylase/DNA lyase
MPPRTYHFTDRDRQHFAELRAEIQARLEDFQRVPASQRFYELCYCLCTPQSKAENANAVVNILQERDFERLGFDPVAVLRDKTHYIRFHETKAKRLLQAREHWSAIAAVLDSTMNDEQKREWLVENVDGMSWKEASHYLRNIGYRNLAILDRHTLKHLVRCGVFDDVPNIAGKSRYLAAGEGFKTFAAWVGVPMDELDLFFWASEAGLILK